jgi:hypothetical protein
VVEPLTTDEEMKGSKPASCCTAPGKIDWEKFSRNIISNIDCNISFKLTPQLAMFKLRKEGDTETNFFFN